MKSVNLKLNLYKIRSSQSILNSIDIKLDVVSPSETQLI